MNIPTFCFLREAIGRNFYRCPCFARDPLLASLHGGTPLLESGASAAAELEYGRSIDSILPRSFGRKSQVRVIQRAFEVVVTEVLPEDLNVLIRGVGRDILQKAYSEFQRFFRSAKTEDAFRNSAICFLGKNQATTELSTRWTNANVL